MTGQGEPKFKQKPTKDNRLGASKHQPATPHDQKPTTRCTGFQRETFFWKATSFLGSGTPPIHPDATLDIPAALNRPVHLTNIKIHITYDILHHQLI
jgi:hypothetical protein